jgi:putative heme transporter
MASVLGTVRDVPTTVPRTATDSRLLEPESDADVSSSVSDPRADRPKRQWARVAFVLLGAVALGVIVATRRDALAASATHLAHLRWSWVPLALGLEWLSISVFARMQRRLLAAGGATVAARPMLATVYAANAIATALPLAGPELGAAFTYRRFKRQGVETPVAGWTLIVGGVLSPLAGIFVLVAGALLSGNDVVATLGALGGVLGVAAIVLLHTAIRHLRLRRLVESAAVGVLVRIRRLLRRPLGDPQGEIGVWADRLASLRPDASVWTRASILALANWLADAGVLAVSIYAVGASVPWQALLLVYGSGVLIRSLGVTPGGIGLVEGTLCLGLVAAGVHVALALASVLLYRFVSFWLVTGAGWVVLLFLRRDRTTAAGIVPNPTRDEAVVPGGLK